MLLGCSPMAMDLDLAAMPAGGAGRAGAGAAGARCLPLEVAAELLVLAESTEFPDQTLAAPPRPGRLALDWRRSRPTKKSVRSSERPLMARAAGVAGTPSAGAGPGAAGTAGGVAPGPRCLPLPAREVPTELLVPRELADCLDGALETWLPTAGLAWRRLMSTKKSTKSSDRAPRAKAAMGGVAAGGAAAGGAVAGGATAGGAAAGGGSAGGGAGAAGGGGCCPLPTLEESTELTLGADLEDCADGELEPVRPPRAWPRAWRRSSPTKKSTRSSERPLIALVAGATPRAGAGAAGTAGAGATGAGLLPLPALEVPREFALATEGADCPDATLEASLSTAGLFAWRRSRSSTNSDKLLGCLPMGIASAGACLGAAGPRAGVVGAVVPVFAVFAVFADCVDALLEAPPRAGFWDWRRSRSATSSAMLLGLAPTGIYILARDLASL